MSRPVRIAYILPVAGMGGSERQMLMLASGLPRDRFTVEFIVLGPRTPMVDGLEAEGIAVHVLGAARRERRNAVRHALGSARAIARFVGVIRRQRYDIVDAWLFHAYGLAALTRPITRIPVLMAGRRIDTRAKEGFGLVDRSIDAIAGRTVDAVVANGLEVAADAIAREHLDPRTVHVIHNGVVMPPPVDPADGRAIRSRHGWAEDDVILACVANLRPEKRLEVLLDALALRPLPPDVRLVIVGDGRERAALERHAAQLGLTSRVTFLGAVPDARGLLPAFDVIVSTSASEGLSNTLLEAAASGRAIVATAATGTGEIVTDGVSGLLVAISDVAALREALDRVIADAALRASLGTAARAHVEVAFGVDRLVRETADLYERLLAARASGSAG